MQFRLDLKRGSLRDNITLCRVHGTPEWRTWWANTLALDAVIGNTDRHTENWGFLIEQGRDGTRYSLAPAFDNGTSLGYIIREADLKSFTGPRRLEALVANGKHHFGWVAGDTAGGQHARLCRTFQDRIPHPRAIMKAALNLADSGIDRLVEWCCIFSFDVPFTEARGQFVAAQLRARGDALARALGA